MTEAVARRDISSLKELCKGHLKTRILETASLDEKLYGGHVYYTACSAECKNANTSCSSEVEDVNEMGTAGINYLALLKGSVTNENEEWHQLPRIIKEVHSLKTTHVLRVGYETLLLIAKQMKKVSSPRVPENEAGQTENTPACFLKENENNLVVLLNTTMGNSHFVIRNIIKNIMKELVSFSKEPCILSNENWSSHTRTEIALAMKTITLTASVHDIEQLNNKKSGDKIAKLLLLSDHVQYAPFLSGVDLTCVGSRNIRMLASRLPDVERKGVYDILCRLNSVNCVFFSDAQTVHSEEMHCKCFSVKNENVRVEYFESLMKDQSVVEDRLDLIVQYLMHNQILTSKENQKRLRQLFQTLVRVIRHKVVTKHKYVVENKLVDAKNERSMGYFRQIIQIVLAMAHGTNYCRLLQGLNYLKILTETKDVQEYIPESKLREILFKALAETHKEIREIAVLFKMDICVEQVERILECSNNNELHGMALLLAANITELNKEKVTAIFKSALERMRSNKGSPTIYKEIHVLWSIFNSLPEDRLFLEGNRLNPVHVVETKKRKAFGVSEIDIVQTYKIDIPYKIGEIYDELILPIFRKSLKVLQTREIYLSENTEESHGEKPENAEISHSADYLQNWYTVRECIMFITVYAITSRDKECLDLLTNALLTVGGHLGVIMTASDAIKSILLYYDSPEETLAYAKNVLNLVITKDLKNIRRDGGIPYVFKALSASECNSKSKLATHYIMKEAIQRSFSLIENRWMFKPVRENSELTFTEDLGISGLVVSKASLEATPEVSNEKYLIHYLNILKSISSDGIFKYDMRVYEPSLFLLSALLMSHRTWKVRNTSLMLYTTLIKKMCKEALNTQEDARYSKISVNQTSKKVLCDCLEYFNMSNDQNGIFSCLVFFSRINEISERERELLKSIRCTSLCKRTRKKIDQILYKTPDQEDDLILSSHKLVPAHVKDTMARVSLNDSENRKEFNALQKCAGISNECMSLESELLEVIGSEDDNVREWAVSQYTPDHSYEYALHKLIRTAKCKACLHKRISYTNNSTECIAGTEQFPSERLNMFRDIPYELFLLQGDQKSTAYAEI
ncbi:hypothetical protein NEAUS07_0831 [Nematocida ausubeli]|nr:hypothetical protein NEAUS07_0791 [Nematocida ausubeli]KAI5134414.1 hypothetical protein NEAUS07_0831 [Nematocida ausubeli]